MKSSKDIEDFADDIQKMNISEEDKKRIQENLFRLKGEKINLMVTGATGCGKSSTINALFGEEVAKVGVSVGPETMKITKYELQNLTIWDTPGLGDGVENDRIHSKNIVEKLHEKDENGNLLIDLVLVILDGGSRDLGTSYDLINNVIIPNLGPDKENRVLVAINQADMAMKGRYWNEEKNEPEQKLIEFLEEKVVATRSRIKEGTGVDITPIYYSAGYKEEGMPQVHPYNLSKLLCYLVKFTPKEKRTVYVEVINDDPVVWTHNDGNENYNQNTEASIWDSIKDYALKGIEFVKIIGPILGPSIPKKFNGIAKGAKKLMTMLKKI